MQNFASVIRVRSSEHSVLQGWDVGEKENMQATKSESINMCVLCRLRAKRCTSFFVGCTLTSTCSHGNTIDMYIKGFDALGNVAEYTISIALFRAPHSTSLSGKESKQTRIGVRDEHECFQQLVN